jgi:hypothetical protein
LSFHSRLLLSNHRMFGTLLPSCSFLFDMGKKQDQCSSSVPVSGWWRYHNERRTRFPFYGFSGASDLLDGLRCACLHARRTGLAPALLLVILGLWLRNDSPNARCSPNICSRFFDDIIEWCPESITGKETSLCGEHIFHTILAAVTVIYAFENTIKEACKKD